MKGDVVFLTQPPNIEWLRVVVMMSVSFLRPAFFARTSDEFTFPNSLPYGNSGDVFETMLLAVVFIYFDDNFFTFLCLPVCRDSRIFLFTFSSVNLPAESVKTISAVPLDTLTSSTGLIEVRNRSIVFTSRAISSFHEGILSCSYSQNKRPPKPPVSPLHGLG